MKPAGAPLFFPRAAEFRAWLEANAEHTSELLVGFHTVASGRPSLTWPESVDEALCFGWIDGVRRRIDAQAYQIRFSPRKPGSNWSAVNIAKAEALIAAGQMRPAGLAAFARRQERRSRIYTYEQTGEAVLGAEGLSGLQADPGAWSYFQALPPGYRRTLLFWIQSAKQAATRARRLARFVDACTLEVPAKAWRVLPGPYQTVIENPAFLMGLPSTVIGSGSAPSRGPG